MKTEIIRYTPKSAAVKHLSLKDAALGSAIKKLGAIERTCQGDHFTELCNCIVSQQISGLAAMSIWGKLSKLLGRRKGLSAAKKILALPDEDLLSCGLSRQKVSYLKTAALEVVEKRLNFEKLEKLTDAEIREVLTKLRGIGNWTAEMMLIFSFGREDILSVSDYGVRLGIMKLKKKKDMKPAEFERLKKRYSPHGTAASIYFWCIADSDEF